MWRCGAYIKWMICTAVFGLVLSLPDNKIKMNPPTSAVATTENAAYTQVHSSTLKYTPLKQQDSQQLPHSAARLSLQDNSHRNGSTNRGPVTFANILLGRTDISHSFLCFFSYIMAHYSVKVKYNVRW